MFRCWRPNVASVVRCWSAVGAVAVPLGVAIVLGMATAAHAVITVTGNPATGFNQANAAVFTVDPFDSVLFANAADRANRGITADRRLRQTFKVPTTFNVGEIILSFDVTGAAEVGLGLRIYEVADVLASAWAPIGLPIKEIAYTSALPASDTSMSFALTGGDVFTLPARGGPGDPAGYGIEISTPFANPTDGNPGLLWFSNMDGDPSPVTDHYADGRYYTETGTGSTSFRDVGLSLIASTAPVCDPGDVNCMGGVTIDDLNIIAAHFRQNGGREQGDLTGNGFIDFDDFGQWKQHYMGPGLAASAFSFLSVPEPGSMSLLLAGVAGLFFRVRRTAVR